MAGELGGWWFAEMGYGYGDGYGMCGVESSTSSQHISHATLMQGRETKRQVDTMGDNGRQWESGEKKRKRVGKW